MTEILGIEFEVPGGLGFFAENGGIALLNGLVWLLMAAVAYLIVYYVAPRLTRRTKTELDDIIIGFIRLTIVLLIIVTGIRQVIHIFTVPSALLSLVDRGYWVMVTWGLAITLWKLLVGIVGVYGQRMAEQTESKIDDILIPMAVRGGTLVLGIIAVFVTIGIVGVEMGTVLAVLGGLSFILIFALHQPLGNMFSGIYLLMDSPFKIGDFIKLGDAQSEQIYRVVKIGLRVTELYDINTHTVAFVPNSSLARRSRRAGLLCRERRDRLAQRIGVAIDGGRSLSDRLLRGSQIDAANQDRAR